MKKVLLVLLSLLVSSYACAESPQLQYIKGMYELSVNLESGDLDSFNYDYFLKYFDDNLQNIYARNNKYQKITGDIACIDHSVLWQGNNLDPQAKLTFTEPSEDKVKVTIGATWDLEERSVTYRVKCEKDEDCKITEIFEYGKPFTKEVTKCLDEFYRTEIKKHKE